MLIFGIAVVIIFLIVSMNPFHILNKYPLLSYMSFFILIVLASSIVLFFNIYKKNHYKFNAQVDKNGNVNFFAKKTSEEFFNYFFKALKAI